MSRRVENREGYTLEIHLLCTATRKPGASKVETFEFQLEDEEDEVDDKESVQKQRKHLDPGMG